MDTLTLEQRKRVMAHNRGRTRPERILASALWRRGLRYLTGSGYRAKFGKPLPGNPDIVFSKKRVIVFMDGCFWHGCRECARTVRQNSAFWNNKIKINRKRDKKITAALQSEGWEVVRIPEHALRTNALVEAVVGSIESLLTERIT